MTSRSDPAAPSRASAARAANEAIIGQLYRCFNERRLGEAAELVAEHAVVEHAPVGQRQRGGSGYLQFAQMWTRAFPDAVLTVERVVSQDGRTYEVDLMASGTHLGALDMGSGGVFRPSGARASMRLRQLLEIQGGRITLSSLSFDLQDIVHQLVAVDVPKLLEHVQRVRQLGEKLAAAPEGDVLEQRNLVDRLGAELDAARRVVRPHFGR